MSGLTERQNDAFLFIQAYTKESNGVPPSYRQIADAIGLKSVSNVQRIIIALEERRKIQRLPRRARAIKIMGV